MKFFRKTAEFWARGKCFKRHLSVNKATWPIFISPDAQLKYIKVNVSAFDQDLIAIAETFVDRESIIWDVGANVGVFTYASAAMASEGTIVSVEADIWLAGLLRRTRRLKEYSSRDVRILPVAVSAQDGVAVFKIAARGRASNALESAGGSSQMGGIREKQYVPCLSLDTLLKSQPEPSFIKMDVEGAEAQVLRGATVMLSKIRPVFYMEVAGSNRKEIEEMVQKQNYHIFSPFGEERDKITEPNVFLVPLEKISFFAQKVGLLQSKLQ